MNVIRLTRVGKKKDASFRVIVIDSKRKVQAGNYLEMVGSYDPRSNKADLKADRIKRWMDMGAKPSDTVHNLLVSNKIIEGKKINVLPKKVLAKPEEPAAPAAEAAPAVVAAEAVAAETTEDKAAETPADSAEAPAADVAADAPADATADAGNADAGAAGGDASASA